LQFQCLKANPKTREPFSLQPFLKPTKAAHLIRVAAVDGQY
jgi:hypothetical protein